MNKYIFLVAFATLALVACDKPKVYYSCNPNVDEVIRQNLPYYSQMTRDEWKTLPDSLKDAAYVAMTPEVKKTFWNGKYNEMIESKHFSNAEKVHISKLYNYAFSIDDFFISKDSLNSEVKNYYKEWALYGVDYLNWDVFDVILIAENIEELTDEYISVFKAIAINHPDDNTTHNTTLKKKGDDCDCNYSIGCGLWYACLDIECPEVEKCGLLWKTLCHKKCNYPEPNGGTGSSNTPQLVDMSQRELVLTMFEPY